MRPPALPLSQRAFVFGNSPIAEVSCIRSAACSDFLDKRIGRRKPCSQITAFQSGATREKLLVITQFDSATELLTTRRAVLKASGASFAVSLVSGCGVLLATRCRVALTCLVSIGGASYSGRSIIEITSSPELLKVGDAPVRHTYVMGEALVIDVPGTPIFVTLNVPGPASTLPVAVVEAFFGPVTGPDDFNEKLARLARGGSGGRIVTIAQENVPRIVRFKKLADPSSIEEVALNKGTAADAVPVFDGLLLRCQVTNENVTRQLHKAIPWIYSMSDSSFKHDHAGDDWSLAATTTVHSFIGR